MTCNLHSEVKSFTHVKLFCFPYACCFFFMKYVGSRMHGIRGRYQKAGNRDGHQESGNRKQAANSSIEEANRKTAGKQ